MQFISKLESRQVKSISHIRFQTHIHMNNKMKKNKKVCGLLACSNIWDETCMLDECKKNVRWCLHN